MPEQCACEFGFSHLPTSFKHSLSPYHHTLRTSGFYIGSVAPGGGRFAYTQSDSQQSTCIIRGDRNGINCFVPWRRGGHFISGPVRVCPTSAHIALGCEVAVTVGPNRGEKSLFVVAAVRALVRHTFITALRCSRAGSVPLEDPWHILLHMPANLEASRAAQSEDFHE